MPPPPEPESARWWGWQRLPGSRLWERVAGGRSREEARARLLAVPCAAKSRDLYVGPRGVDPNSGTREGR